MTPFFDMFFHVFLMFFNTSLLEILQKYFWMLMTLVVNYETYEINHFMIPCYMNMEHVGPHEVGIQKDLNEFTK